MTAAAATAPTFADAQVAAGALVQQGVSEVLLYGSVARGEQREDSDIDLVAIFGDLDYTRRYKIKQQLVDVAHETSGYECNVVVTDRPEWVNRIQRVSSSFERRISHDTISIAWRGENEIVNWDKEMSKPMTNGHEAEQVLTNEIFCWLADLRSYAFHWSKQARFENRWDKRRFDYGRMESVCKNASLLIEQSLKSLIILQGNYPIPQKELRKYYLEGSHFLITERLRQLTQPYQRTFRNSITRSGINISDISQRVEEYFYGYWLFPRIAEANENAEEYVCLSLSIVWTVLDQIERQTGQTAKTEWYRKGLERAVALFQSTDIRSGQPRETPDPAHQPAPIPPEWG